MATPATLNGRRDSTAVVATIVTVEKPVMLVEVSVAVT